MSNMMEKSLQFGILRNSIIIVANLIFVCAIAGMANRLVAPKKMKNTKYLHD